MLAEKYGTLEQAKANAGKPFEADPWLKALDWSIVGTDAEGNPVPAWYARANGARNITAKTDLAHKLLKLEWQGSPVLKTKDMGYCYTDKSGKQTRLPHKNGGGNCGGCFAPYYMPFIEDGTLSSSEPACLEIMRALQQSSFWIGYKSRLTEAAVFAMQNPADGRQVLAIAPDVCPANTVSLRTGSALWLTLASHTVPKPAGEVKSKVAAWPGWLQCNYDLDAMELNAAARFSDSYAGLVGSTAISYSCLVGTKKAKTEVHWLSAISADCGRDA